MPRPPLRSSRETIVSLYVAAAVGAVLCWSDVRDVVDRMEYGVVRENLLAVLQPVQAPPPQTTAMMIPPPPPPPPPAPPPAPEPEHPTWWRPISEAEPLRVWVAGDSLVNLTAPELKRQLEATTLAVVQTESRPSTGLVRQDFFDWPARFEAQINSGQFDVVVMMVGANDSQNMMVDRTRIELRSDAWLEEYDQRIAALMDLAEEAGVRLYWAGLPVMRNSRHQRTAELVNPLLQAAAEARTGVQFVSTWDLFSGEDGEYQYWGYNDKGTKVSMRDADGVHFTMTGAIHLAEHLRAALEVDWPLSEDAAAVVGGDPDSGRP